MVCALAELRQARPQVYAHLRSGAIVKSRVAKRRFVRGAALVSQVECATASDKARPQEEGAFAFGRREGALALCSIADCETRLAKGVCSKLTLRYLSAALLDALPLRCMSASKGALWLRAGRRRSQESVPWNGAFNRTRREAHLSESGSTGYSVLLEALTLRYLSADKSAI